MSRRPIAAAIALVATVAVVRLIVGHYPDEGPYVTVTPTHGIHAGDVVLAVLWLVLMAGLWRWVRPRRVAAEG